MLLADAFREVGAVEFDCGPLVHINGYIVDAAVLEKDPSVGHYYVRQTGTNAWAIFNDFANFCLSKSEKQFVYQSLPSNRTDEFKDDTRFDSPDDAKAFLEAWKVEELKRVEDLGWITFSRKWAGEVPNRKPDPRFESNG